MPVGYQGYSNTDFARSIQTTLAQHIRDEEQAWMRSFAMGALLESQGRIIYNQSGRGFDWPVRYKGHSLEANNGTTTRNFAPVNLWKNAFLEYRGYQVTDSYTEKEFRENQAEEALIRLADNFISRMEESVKQRLAAEFFVDGNATGNTDRWHGLESFFGGSQTVTAGTAGATGRSANAADIALYPSDTYAGLSTILGNYGGSGDSALDWPQGQADPEFDFWSPVVLNYTSTHALFPSSTNTWAGQADEVMRYGIITTQRNSMANGQLSNILLERNLYHNVLNLIDGKEQINVNRNEPNGLTALGFKNVVVFDGVEISWDVAVPATVGYGFNPANMELRCMYESIFVSEGPFYDEHTQRYNAVVKSLSNLRCSSPRNFLKFDDIA